MTTQMVHTDNLETGDTINVAARVGGKDFGLDLYVKATKRDRAVVTMADDQEHKLGDLSVTPPLDCDDEDVIACIHTERASMADTVLVTDIEITARTEGEEERTSMSDVLDGK